MEIVFESERIIFCKVNIDLIDDYLIMINDIKNQELISDNRKIYTYQDELSWVDKKLKNDDIVFSMIDKNTNKLYLLTRPTII